MGKIEIKQQIKELEDELRKLYALEKYGYLTDSVQRIMSIKWMRALPESVQNKLNGIRLRLKSKTIIRSDYILFKFQISFTALTILLKRLSMLNLSQTGCSLSVTNSIISFC